MILSNAPRHIISQRTKAYHTSIKTEQKDTEREQIRKLIIPYILITKFSGAVINSYIPIIHDEVSEMIETLTLSEVRIEAAIRGVSASLINQAGTITEAVISANLGLSEDSQQAEYIEPREFSDVLDEARATTAKLVKQDWKILEMSLSLLRSIELNEESFLAYIGRQDPPAKRKPGRPPKAKPEPKRKNMTLNDFFKSKK